MTYLEEVKKNSIKKESLFASCLASFIGSLETNNSFFHSQAYILLEQWVPNGWLDKYLNKRTKVEIDKNLKFL